MNTYLKFLSKNKLYAVIEALGLSVALGFLHSGNDSAQISVYTETLASKFNISLWTLIVPLVTGILIAKKMPALPVLGISMVLAAVCAIILQPHIISEIGNKALESMGISTGEAGVLFTGIVKTVYDSVSVDTGVEEVNMLVSSRGMLGMLKAVAQAVQLVHDGEGDVLMKGLCSTDKFLRAILNKENGLLPPKGLLSHVGILESPNYHKLLFLTDMAVLPLPDFRQKIKQTNFVVKVAKSFGIAKPKVAFLAASEQVLDSMPACMEAAALAKMVDRGQIRGCIADGPLALDVAIDNESVEIKKLVSPVAGDADCLVFPNIESANVFWKTNSKLSPDVRQAGMLVGTTAPCILASRADSVDTKLNSIAEAVMSIL